MLLVELWCSCVSGRREENSDRKFMKSFPGALQQTYGIK
jgi:hypothetical protein